MGRVGWHCVEEGGVGWAKCYVGRVACFEWMGFCVWVILRGSHLLPNPLPPPTVAAPPCPILFRPPRSDFSDATALSMNKAPPTMAP